MLALRMTRHSGLPWWTYIISTALKNLPLTMLKFRLSQVARNSRSNRSEGNTDTKINNTHKLRECASKLRKFRQPPQQARNASLSVGSDTKKMAGRPWALFNTIVSWRSATHGCSNGLLTLLAHMSCNRLESVACPRRGGFRTA